MQVDASALLSIVATIATAVLAGYFALTRYALSTKEKELEHRIEAAATDAAEAIKSVIAEQAARVAQLERFHEKEQRVTRLEGDLALVRQAAGTLGEDVREIKDSMVPRHEWEANAERVDRQLESILVELRRSPRYASSSTHSASPSVPPRPAKKAGE